MLGQRPVHIEGGLAVVAFKRLRMRVAHLQVRVQVFLGGVLAIAVCAVVVLRLALLLKGKNS